MASTPSPHVSGASIGDAYTRALESRLKNDWDHRYRFVHVSDPVTSIDSLPSSIDFDDWRSTVNAGDALSAFESYRFYDGTTGHKWIQSRIDELFDGMYDVRLRDGRNQLEQITERLKKGNHGQTTNALVAQVFRDDPDLEMATHGRPLAPDIACLTQLQFRPTRDTLNLYSVFRSQFFDTKCYGNLISLAILLARVCDKTGYEPGFILETVHNTHFRDHDDAKGLYDAIKREGSECTEQKTTQ
jgi:hypothetical protein